MNPYIPLLVAAGGPIVVILINKIFDGKHHKTLHDLSKKRSYFERKLQVYEKATSYYTNAHLSVTNMSTIFETILKENVLIDGDTVSRMFEEISFNLKEVNKITQPEALSLSLYADIPMLNSDEQLFQTYIEQIGEMNACARFMEMAQTAAGNTDDEQEKKRLDGLVEEELKKMAKLIIPLKETSNKVRNTYRGVIKILRKELVDYD